MKILVPVDDQYFASLICDFIGNHQWPDASEFLVFHSVDAAIYDSFNLAFGSLVQPSEQEAMEEGKTLVEKTAERLRQIFPLLVVHSSVETGEPTAAIARMARQWSADIIIAGSHGRRGFNRLVLGSVSLSLLATAPCSVLLVTPDVANHLAGTEFKSEKISGPFVGRILIAIDESHVSDQIIDFVSQHRWSKATHFKLITIVRFAHSIGLYPSPDLERSPGVLQARRAHLEAAYNKLRAALPENNIVSELVEGDEKHMIAQLASDWYASMIVIGHHNHKGVQKLFGSASLATFSAAQASVLMLREKTAGTSVNARENRLNALAPV